MRGLTMAGFVLAGAALVGPALVLQALGRAWYWAGGWNVWGGEQ